MESNYKYYVVDLGLRNILQNNAPFSDLGHKLDSFISIFAFTSQGKSWQTKRLGLLEHLFGKQVNGSLITVLALHSFDMSEMVYSDFPLFCDQGSITIRTTTIAGDSLVLGNVSYLISSSF